MRAVFTLDKSTHAEVLQRESKIISGVEFSHTLGQKRPFQQQSRGHWGWGAWQCLLHSLAIRAFPGRGIRVWGARTLSSDPEWRYLNIRRLFNMIEKSIDGGTQWVVFEPNDFSLWQKIVRNVSAFLKLQWRDGALFGATPEEAFFVKCDAETNPQESIDLGMVVTEIGIAPVKPAEFVIFRISQWTPEA